MTPVHAKSKMTDLKRIWSTGFNVTFAKNGFMHFLQELKSLLKSAFVNSVLKKKSLSKINIFCLAPFADTYFNSISLLYSCLNEGQMLIK